MGELLLSSFPNGNSIFLYIYSSLHQHNRRKCSVWMVHPLEVPILSSINHFPSTLYYTVYWFEDNDEKVGAALIHFYFTRDAAQDAAHAWIADGIWPSKSKLDVHIYDLYNAHNQYNNNVQLYFLSPKGQRKQYKEYALRFADAIKYNTECIESTYLEMVDTPSTEQSTKETE